MKKIKNIFLTATHLLIGSVCFAQDNLPVSGQIAEHEYVDLGLPSGTLWATYNVGATKPTEYGDYFAWGETKPKEVYADSTYKWFYADSKIYTKYNSEDGLKTLLPEDDAATANWGSEWRMPTNEEQRELVEECQYQMTEVNGVYGAKFTGKNGNSVFFPASGFRYGSVVGYEGGDGLYWSSSLDEDDEVYARGLNFGVKGVYWGNDLRSDGFSVRAVANKTTDIEEYVVSFYTQDSVLIESQKVEKGKSATAVDAPVVDGYEFIGWSDSSFTNVSKDLDIYAKYKEIITLPVSGQIAGHDYIDFGLPSGTLWATCNVGATTPTGYGHHFAWGETETKKVYDWSTYKWCEGSKNSLTKYFDKKMELDSEDDAAMVNWGKEWRMPTSEEQGELLENCYMVWTTNYLGTDVAGVIFYKAKDEKDKGEYIAEWRQRDLSASYNVAYDAHIFLPAAGGRWGNDNNSEGKYWSSSLSLEYDKHYHASFLGFTGKDFGHDEPYYCIYGFSVRAVANKTTDIEEYVVSFYTQDSVLIESQKVEKGKSTTDVDAPVVDGYEFIGWSDSSFTNVMKDLDIYAQYKAITKDTLPVSGQIAGHDYVDLGLPSGTLWATYNVGATKPTEYGGYFAWGETKPKEDYSWSTYKWKEGPFTKYCTDSGYGTVDNKTVLEAEDDAATANWGSAWRMPTTEEQRELLDGCSWEWVEDFNGSGVSGRLGTSKKNGATIFLPAAGSRHGTAPYLAGSYGTYWSSSLYEDIPSSAYDLYFYDYIIDWNFSSRLYGHSVRAVTSDNQTNTSNIISNPALKVYAENSTIHVVNAQPNTNIQVFDMSGKAVASGTTDANGNVEISLSTSKGVYVVTDGSQSTKVILK